MNNEIMQLCRLCLVKDRASVPIFAEQSDRQIFVKITACLPIRVSREDSLPKKICDSCLDKLDSLYQFRNTTVNAEKQLLTWLGQAVVETEFKMIQGAPLMQTEIHSIKQEELDPLENIPENMHENFVSLADPHFPELIRYSESQAEFYGIEDERFQSNNLQKITRDYSGSAPAKRRKQQVAPKLVNNDDTENKEEVYRTAIATVIVKTEKDNECIDAEDMGKNPQINFTSSEIDGKEQAELFGMHQKDEREDILKRKTYIFRREQRNKQANQLQTNKKTDEKFFKNNTIINDPATLGHNSAHVGDKQFRCNLCDYKSVEAENLKAHMSIHIGEKLFKCDLCDFRCRTFEDLERHMLSHAGKNRDKPLKCNLCNYRCSFSAYLKKHMLTHTGEKPFKCDLCDYKCNQSWSLKRHMVRHSAKKPSKRSARKKKSGRSSGKS